MVCIRNNKRIADSRRIHRIYHGSGFEKRLIGEMHSQYPPNLLVYVNVEPSSVLIVDPSPPVVIADDGVPLLGEPLPLGLPPELLDWPLEVGEDEKVLFLGLITVK